LYDKEIADYRTTSVNVIIELTRLISNNSGEEKSGQPKIFFDLSASVPKEGIEPSHPKIHDFESCICTAQGIHDIALFFTIQLMFSYLSALVTISFLDFSFLCCAKNE